MKHITQRIIYALIVATIVVLGTSTFAFAATSVFQTFQGGTGTSSPSGILYGDNGATNHINTVVIGSGLSFSAGTLSATGGSGGSGNVATSTSETAGQLAYWTSTAGTPATLGKVATSTPTVNAPITYSGTLGSFVGGTGGAFDCTTATGSVKGCLAAADFTTFNGKQAAGNYITALTGDVTAAGPGSVAATLATVNTNTGSWGSSTAIPNFTVNGKGLITAAGTNAVIAPAGTLSGATLNATVVTSSLTSVSTITSGTWNGTTIDIAHGGTSSTTALANAIKYFDPTAAFETASTSFVRVASGNVGNGTSSPFASFSTTIASNTPAFVAWALGSSTPALYVGSANQNGDVGFGTSVPDSPVTINMNTSGAPPALGAFTGTTLHTIGVDGLANRVVQDSFGGATVYSLRRADGTNGSPTALASGDNVFTFGGAGWNGSAYTSTKAQYNMIATQPWTTTANGIGFNWLVTQNNSTLLFMAMTLDNTGHLGIGTTTPFAGLQIATSSVNTLQNGTFGQFALTDTSAGLNLKHWLFSSDSGTFTLGTTSDLFATGTPALTITLNQNFGIGSSSPAQKLSVNGIIYSGSGGFQFPDGTIQTTAAAGGSNFFTNSGANTWLTTGSNLGIGSSTPFATLSVSTTTNSSGSFQLFSVASSTNATLFNVLGNGNIGIGTTSPYAELSINAPATSLPYFVIGSSTSEVFKIAPSANAQLGIGTSTPTAAFVSVAASTTSGTTRDGYNGVVAIIAGFENSTLKLFEEVDQWGHFITSGDTPTISGGTSTVVGNDRNGTITVTGTLLTSVTLTFAHSYVTAPDCVISDSSTGITAGVTSISTTQLVIGFSAGVNSGTVWYICQGHQ